MTHLKRSPRRAAIVACACALLAPICASAGESGLYRQAWRLPLVDDQFISWKLEERAVPGVHLTTRMVFAGSSAGEMVAADAVSGETIWKFKVGSRIASEPLAEDGVVYFGADDGGIYALSMYTGKQIWRYQTATLVSARPVIAGGRLFAQTRQNQVVALDLKTGKWLWHFQREAPTGFTVESAAGPAVAEGLVYAGFSDGYAAAINIEDGSQVWAKKLTKKSQFTDAWGTPLVAGDRVYFAMYADGIVCLDSKKGQELWRVDLPGASAPLQTGDRLAATTADGEVVSIDAFGKIASRRSLGGGAFSAPYDAGDGYFAFSASSGSVYVVKASTMKVAQAIKPGTGVCGRPVLTPRSLYFVSNRGVLYKYSQP